MATQYLFVCSTPTPASKLKPEPNRGTALAP